MTFDRSSLSVDRSSLALDDAVKRNSLALDDALHRMLNDSMELLPQKSHSAVAPSTVSVPLANLFWTGFRSIHFCIQFGITNC